MDTTINNDIMDKEIQEYLERETNECIADLRFTNRELSAHADEWGKILKFEIIAQDMYAEPEQIIRLMPDIWKNIAWLEVNYKLVVAEVSIDNSNNHDELIVKTLHGDKYRLPNIDKGILENIKGMVDKDTHHSDR